MGRNILVTGASGFIGGSVLAELISRTSGPIKTAKISAAVRTTEQAQTLSKLGVRVVQVDLNDTEAVKEAVVSNEIDIVVHTASAIDSRIPSALIEGLGQRRALTGDDTYFIHSAVATLFSAEGGWPYGQVKDTDPLYEKEKEIGVPHPVRNTSILVTELAKSRGVTSFIIPVPQVYGRGSGEWRKLSVAIPAAVRASIKHKKVYKFDVDSKPPSVHVSDLAAFYTLLTEKILEKVPIPSGENGYYFVIGHTTHWWDTMEGLAKALHARGLVEEPKAEIWPSDDMAAEYLGFPRLYVRAMGTSNGDFVPAKARQLGWEPRWDEKRFLGSLDDEIQAVLDLDTVKATLFDILTAK